MIFKQVDMNNFDNVNKLLDRQINKQDRERQNDFS